MKKIVVSMVGAALACAAFAAQNDALVSFSTPGPDTYADGSTVRDGECYALVWIPANEKEFELAADGTAKGGEIVLVAPVARNGRCPGVVFQVPADKVEKDYKDGSWGVYLLDTRRWGANGAVTLAGVGADGKAKVVNAAGAVAGSKVAVGTGSISEVVTSGSACAASLTAEPANVPKPEISAIRVMGGNVYVTVKGTMPCLRYGLSSGATPERIDEGVGEAQSGAVNAAEEIILVAPAKEGGAFFKVGRR